ncbi:hypothetical protein ACC717_37550, partial [Rhizobium ruizarguesonis]
LTTRDTHAAITVDEQMLYGTLVDCQLDFAQDTNNLGWLHFAMSDRFIITSSSKRSTGRENLTGFFSISARARSTLRSGCSLVVM